MTKDYEMYKTLAGLKTNLLELAEEENKSLGFIVNGVLRYSESLCTNSNWGMFLIWIKFVFWKKLNMIVSLLTRYFFDVLTFARSHISHASDVIRIPMHLHVIHRLWRGVLYFMSPKLHWFPLLARSKAHHIAREPYAHLYIIFTPCDLSSWQQ